MPPCLDSNTRGHILILRLSRRRACMFRVTCSFSRCLCSARICSYYRGMRDEALSHGPVPPLPRHSLSHLAVITLICEIHTPSLNGLSDATYTIWVVLMMKCEHGVVSALILRDRGRSYTWLGRASLKCMLLCVESLAGA